MPSLRMMAAFSDSDTIFFDENDVIYNVSLLPQEMRTKIFIQCMKNYWKEYVPLTAQVPTWFAHKVKVEQELYQSRLKNIHFSHLSYNCIPEMLTWIPGCQCSYCLNNAPANHKIVTYAISKDKQMYKRIYPSYSHVQTSPLNMNHNGDNDDDSDDNDDNDDSDDNDDNDDSDEDYENDEYEQPIVIYRENPNHDPLFGTVHEDPVKKNLRENKYNFTFSEDILDSFNSLSGDEDFITLSSDDDDY